jgi:hypothetical protein
MDHLAEHQKVLELSEAKQLPDTIDASSDVPVDVFHELFEQGYVDAALDDVSASALVVGTHVAVLFRSRRPNRKMCRHLRKYAEGRLGEDRSFYFRGPDEKVCLRAYNLASFMELGEGLDAETWLHHLQRNDYSEWTRTAIRPRRRVRGGRSHARYLRRREPRPHPRSDRKALHAAGMNTPVGAAVTPRTDTSRFVVYIYKMSEIIVARMEQTTRTVPAGTLQ